MMKKKDILFISALMLCGCSEDLNIGQDSADAVELRGITAEVVSGNVFTRAESPATPETIYDIDYTSRFQFLSGDQMTFTKIQRTEHPITRFQYKDVAFNSNASGAWERDKTTGYTLEVKGGNIDTDAHPERIYWSDAKSPHTFVGFSLPKSNTAFDWKKSSYYYDLNNEKCEFDTYYGAIGDPTNATEEIDYNPTTPTTETITAEVDGEEKSFTIGYSQKLRDEDLLLTYDDALIADNSVANIKFYHALSSVRVVVNISGFYGTENDAYSTVSNFVLHNQPTMYRWTQQSRAVEALLTANENTTLHQETLWRGESTNAPQYNQRKNIKLWNTNPEGEGQGASKTFVFYGITVPQDENYFNTFNGNDYSKLEMSFDVSYPDPLKNDPVNKKITKPYKAFLDNPVKFYPGKCTTINISLNHKDETITVGASYESWEYIETPDDGALKKKSTFLSSAPSLANRTQAGVTIIGDEKATADDATWLYENKDNSGSLLGIFDIYGNDGSETSPYTISTANQLLSFAYEVQNGRNFAGKYVKLEADITLQPKSSLDLNSDGTINTSKLVSWIGIGTETAKFEGIFNGNGRHINNLYGQPFFNIIGEYAVVNKVSFANVVGVNGCGVVAHKNTGLICGINIEGDIKAGASDNYVGSIVGDNESFIVACTHVGSVEVTGGTSSTHVGGLVGRNNGTIIASYHAGPVKGDGGADVHAAIGYVCEKTNGDTENDSQAFSCYFNSNYNSSSRELVPGKTAFPRTTGQMQSNSFVNATTEIIPVESGVGDAGDELFKHHYSLNQAMVVFKQWIDAIVANKSGDDWPVETNCHTFSKRQVLWLQTHYGESHRFTYVPGAYPKIN